MNAEIITPPPQVTLLNKLTIFDCELFKEQFNTDIKINTILLNADILINDIYAHVRTRQMTADIVDVLIKAGGDGGSEMASLIFNFSQSDLLNGKLRKVHNFNQSVVDVSVINNVGSEIMVSLEIINSNTIELDFSRVQIDGVWQLLIEK